MRHEENVHGPGAVAFAALGDAAFDSQENHMAISLMCVYGDPAHEAWFREAWAKTGRKVDMGKSCVRFKKLDEVPLKVIGQAARKVPVKKFIAYYESTLGSTSKRRTPASAKKASGKKATCVKGNRKNPSPKKTAATSTRKSTAKYKA